ncbi:MAG: 2-oxoacid:ferredoxin oxidoreductase subunit beta [Alphaproteobacteria bacterium]|nr:2-oxoacid:ferredoxin oxidoreductase subunit beta [Alphaproteobacteria bacterium]
MGINEKTSQLKPADYASDQEVRWCPGCGDYAILNAVKKTLADKQAKTEKTVFVSGIGCSSRLPYYMATYGFHTIHGRAPAFATGIKLTNPELDVWIITGDGDSLSIGGNHFIHLLRRNLNCQVLLFNNEIYGLTKGQASPASRTGTISPSTPEGSSESPISACELALSAGATFVARGVDTAIKQLVPTLSKAQEHIGTSLVEIYQNCIVYNDDVFKSFTDKSVAIEKQIHLENGKPMLFGENNMKGLVINKDYSALEIVDLEKNAEEISRVLIHNYKNKTIANLLTQMDKNLMPVALGVIYCIDKPTLDNHYSEKVNNYNNDISKIMEKGQTWTI